MCDYLFLDGERFSSIAGLKMRIISSQIEAIEWLKTCKQAPIFVSFENDLEESDYIVAKWMVEKDIETCGKWIPKDFVFNSRSTNSIFHQNIEYLFTNYLTWRDINS